MAVAETPPFGLKVIGAPTLSSTGAVGITLNGADIFVTTNQAGGTLYWTADEATGVPDVTQVMAGNSATGVSATASGSAVVANAGIQGPFRVEPFGQGRIVNYWFTHMMTAELVSAPLGASFATLTEEGNAPGDDQTPDTLVSFYNTTGVTPNAAEDPDAEAQRAKSIPKTLGG